jgi:hypothetical protein
MKPPRPSRADQLREHREIFEYARAHGLTLIEAKDAMARERWKAARDRLNAVRRCGRALPAPGQTTPTEPSAAPIPPDAPWMMRD